MFVIVPLPARLNLNTTNRFISGIIGNGREPKASSIGLDFGALQFIDGAGLTVLCNIVQWLFQKGVTVSFVGYDGYGVAIRYLDDCGFFERYLGQKLRPGAAVRDSSLPAQPIQHANSFGWIEMEASPWMAAQLHVNENSLAGVRACIKELFNNINDHSKQDTGFVHVQLYPAMNKFCMTISDFGVGIPATMAKKYKCKNDAEAIEKSMEEGVTTKDGTRASGAGLAYLSRYVALANKGRIAVYSGTGSLHLQGSPNRLSKTRNAGNIFFPGTLFNLEFPTGTIAAENDEMENLQWEPLF
jgi:anti-sigma regulatory factor (Ser/Thr protein kinase)